MKKTYGTLGNGLKVRLFGGRVKGRTNRLSPAKDDDIEVILWKNRIDVGDYVVHNSVIKKVTERRGECVKLEGSDDELLVTECFIVKPFDGFYKMVRRSIREGYLPYNLNDVLINDADMLVVTVDYYVAFVKDCVRYGGNYYHNHHDDVVELIEGGYSHIDNAKSAYYMGDLCYTRNSTVTVGDEDYYDSSTNLDYYDIVFQQDTCCYDVRDNSQNYNDEWYSYDWSPPEVYTYDYHSGPRADYTEPSTEFKISFEVEKEDRDAKEEEYADELFERTGWVKEKDGSLDSDSGFETISPIYDLFATDFPKVFDSVKRILNADYSSTCGGHINFSETGRTGEQIFEDIYGYIPMLYTMFPNRIDLDYSKVKPKRRYIESRDKYSAVFIKDSYVELRIFGAVKSVANLLWRTELLKLIAKNMTSDPFKVIGFMIDRKHNLHKHLLKVYSPEQLVNKAKLLIDYLYKYDRINYPKHRLDQIQKVSKRLVNKFDLNAPVVTTDELEESIV